MKNRPGINMSLWWQYGGTKPYFALQSSNTLSKTIVQSAQFQNHNAVDTSQNINIANFITNCRTDYPYQRIDDTFKLYILQI